LPFAKQKLSGEDQNSDIQSKMFANHVASHDISVKLPTSASSENYKLVEFCQFVQCQAINRETNNNFT